MTSEERHAARRERRMAKREHKRLMCITGHDRIEVVADTGNLYCAAHESSKGVKWKASTQKYNQNLLRNIWKTKHMLLNGEDVRQGFIEFDLRDRGKARHIRSVHFFERVVQRSLCDYVLSPVFLRNLVYDNGASQTGKGIHFALNRCKKHLLTYYRRYGTNDGWILQIDFSGYFDHINHDVVFGMFRKELTDPRLIKLCDLFVEAFGEEGLGIGSQISQVLAVAYPNRMDHYIKEVLRCGLSARYMDDTYVMSDSKEKLVSAYREIRRICDDLGIIINTKKTKIVPLKAFEFLKVRYRLTDTGKVIMLPCRKSFYRMRRKLVQLKGKIPYEAARCMYHSFHGYQAHLDCRKRLYEMDKIFRRNFQNVDIR